MKSRKLGAILKVGMLAVVSTLLAGCFTLEFSPDGKRVVFLWSNPAARGKMTLATCALDGSGFRELPNALESPYAHWSPDGTRIAYSNEKGISVFNLATGQSKVVCKEYAGELAWTSASEIVFQSVNQSVQGEFSSLVWFDLEKDIPRQTASIPDRSEMVRDIVRVPRTDGVLFLGSGDLYLAEFGEAKKITTTGDVVGFAIDSAKNTAIFARKSNNAQYILLSLYEYDLRLRSVKKLPFPDRVAGVNPVPRQGPREVTYVKFSSDIANLLVFTLRKSDGGGQFKVWEDLYWVSISGDHGSKLVSLEGSSDSQGIMAAIAPDGKSIAALYATKESLTLASYPTEGGDKRILKRVSAPK